MPWLAWLIKYLLFLVVFLFRSFPPFPFFLLCFCFLVCFLVFDFILSGGDHINYTRLRETFHSGLRPTTCIPYRLLNFLKPGATVLSPGITLPPGGETILFSLLAPAFWGCEEECRYAIGLRGL